MESTAGAAVVSTPRFVVVADLDGVWAAVESIRLRDGEAAEAVTEVRGILERTRTRVASWWVSDRSTPADVEAQLVGAGLQVIPTDYRLDGLLATSPPPPGPPEVEVRRIDNVADWVEVRGLQEETFDNPPERRATPELLAAEFERTSAVLFGAWLDGELAAAGAAMPTSRGMLLWGGATRPKARGRGCYRALVRARWDEAVRRGTPALTVSANEQSGPVLRRLGFEQVVAFRRLEDVLSWG